MMTVPPLHITVAAFSMPGKFNDLSHEVRLVKAALLYADQVTLASPKATLVTAIGGLALQPMDLRREAIRSIVASTPNGKQALDVITTLRRQRRGSLTPGHLLVLRQAEEAFQRAEAGMTQVAEEMLSDESLPELSEAMAAGLLTLDPMGLDQPILTTEIIGEAVQKLLASVISPSSQTYPMFDDSAGGLMRAMVNDGAVDDVRLSRATQAGLAGRYIEQLEAFPDAEMSVILEARRTLAQPLTRFRSGLSEMASELGSTPIDQEFAAAADDAYRREIEPALEDLHDLAQQRRLLPALRREIVGQSASAGAKGAVAFAMATAAGLHGIAEIAAGVTAAADIAGAVAASRREAVAKMRENKFLWLYEAPTRLVSR